MMNESLNVYFPTADITPFKAIAQSWDKSGRYLKQVGFIVQMNLQIALNIC